jgi:hypothetical protein
MSCSTRQSLYSPPPPISSGPFRRTRFLWKVPSDITTSGSSRGMPRATSTSHESCASRQTSSTTLLHSHAIRHLCADLDERKTKQDTSLCCNTCQSHTEMCAWPLPPPPQQPAVVVHAVSCVRVQLNPPATHQRIPTHAHNEGNPNLIM